MSASVPSVWQTNGGIYLGYGVESTEGPPAIGDVLRYTGDRHICWIGNSGAGKSRRLLVPNLALLTGWSMLVIDPKGELLTDVRRAPGGGMARKISIFDPFGISGMPSRGCNLLQALDPASDDFSMTPWARPKGLSRSATPMSRTGRNRFRTSLPPSPCSCGWSCRTAIMPMCARCWRSRTPRCAT